MVTEHCHAGGELHGPAECHGSFRWLCRNCWEGVCRILRRDPDTWERVE